MADESTIALVFDVDGMTRGGIEILLTANGNALAGQMVNPYVHVNHVVRLDTRRPKAKRCLFHHLLKGGCHLWLRRRKCGFPEIPTHVDGLAQTQSRSPQ